MQKAKINPFISYINWRITKNKNAIIVINGATGSGKTYAALRLAIDLAQEQGLNFSISDNMAFKFSDLLQKMELPGNDKPGQPFVFEEVGSIGSGSSSREWQSQSNKFFFSFMQTARHRNQILILTCPNFGYLDKGAREMTHIQMTMTGINFGNKTASVKPFRLQVNATTGKIYFKYIRYEERGVRFKLKTLHVSYPPKDIVEQYEIVKLRFTKELNRSIIDAHNGHNKPDNKIIPSEKKAYLMKELKKLIGKGLSGSKCAKLLDLNIRTVFKYKKEILNNTYE